MTSKQLVQPGKLKAVNDSVPVSHGTVRFLSTENHPASLETPVLSFQVAQSS